MTDVFSSVFSAVNGLVYRCANDADYTMKFMQGAVQGLTGYRPDQLLENAEVGFAGLMDRGDSDRVVTEVDAAIAKGEMWDVFYHLTHRDGHLVPVRERGNAIYENGEMIFLEGLVVSAAAEKELISDLDSLVAQTTHANGEIVGLTTEITQSLRTLKILSINAGIEAARAGDAGRGFALIATEIKSLADHNSEFIQVIQSKLARENSRQTATGSRMH